MVTPSRTAVCHLGLSRNTSRAATAPQAEGGAYYGPTGMGETRGAPGPSWIAPQAADPAAGAALWSLSEKLTGLTFA